MPFGYRAAHPDGRIVHGRLRAATRDGAATSLVERGLWPLELREVAEKDLVRLGQRRMPIVQLALGLRILADLVGAGLPVSRALNAFEELAPPHWRRAIPAIREAVRQGRGLSVALGEAALRLPAEIIGIIRAGEAGSGLAQSLQRAAELAEDAAAARAALLSALAYPAMLAVAGTAAVTLLVAVILPRFALILADVGQTLPTSTRVVLEIASTVRRASLPSIGAAACGILLLQVAIRTRAGRLRCDRFLLRFPVIGALRRAASTSRSCATLAALLDSGVPIASALSHGASACSNAALSHALVSAREDVVRGERLSSALSVHNAMTPTAVRLVRAGEETGRLSAMLSHAARLERAQSLERTKALVRLIEPTLILLTGGLIAFVAAALLQALYSMRPVA